MTYDEIIEAIDEYRREQNRNFASKLYVGITNNVDKRLFGFHRVPRDGHWWIYCPADDIQTARKVEKYYLEKGMQGGDGGGSSESKIVYCYEISEETNEN
jgi:hypothetical protein